MEVCISQVTTLSTPFEADLPAYAQAGWTAVELWLTKLEAYLDEHSVAQAKALLEGQGLRAVGAAGQGGLLLARGAERAAHWAHFRRRLEILAELGVPTLVLAADSDGKAEDEHGGRVGGLTCKAFELPALALEKAAPLHQIFGRIAGNRQLREGD